jgi:lipopolysaccharide biosynthesis glycosyltransferase
MAAKIDSSDKSTIVIACATNEAYAMPLGVALYSMLVNLKRGSNVYICLISSGLSADTIKRLHRRTEVKGVNVKLVIEIPDQTWLESLPVYGYLSAETYLRLTLPTVIPQQFDKVLYLDCDLLICGDVSELWNEDIGSYSVMAQVDYFIKTVGDDYGLPNYAELNLEPDHPLFNGGVLVMNLKKWREQNISAKVLDYIMAHRSIIRYADQDALNGVLANDWKQIDFY